MKISKRFKGFTLMELLAVLAIIGILVGLILPNVLQAITQGQETQCLSNLRSIDTAATMCFTQTQTWASCGSDGSDLTDLKPYFPNDTAPVCPFGVDYTLTLASDGVSLVSLKTAHFALYPALPHVGVKAPS